LPGIWRLGHRSTPMRGLAQASMHYKSVLIAKETGITRATGFQIHLESSILLHPLPILPRNPHI